MIKDSQMELSTVYTVMKQVQTMMSSLCHECSVITFALAIHMKVKEIQWHNPEESDDTVIRMGGFHIVFNYLAVIGKMFKNQGCQTF